MTLEHGFLLYQRYRIVEILGQGGMASVYRAIDENLEVEVAVKENLFTTEDYARQFRLEATILASLRHPNLPRVTDHFVIEGKGQYLVMDYIEGEDLRQRSDRLGIIPEDEAVVIGAAICDALTYLHTLTPAIVHRDIKPANIKINPHGQIFLVDFGLAKVVQEGLSTTTGARAMTPGYSPPEQYGTARTDSRSDIYSLGAFLYSVLTDVLPEDGLERVMEQVNLTPLREHNPRVSRQVAAVIEKALNVLPDDRYQSASDFRKHLLTALNNSWRKGNVPRLVEPPPAWVVTAAQEAAAEVEESRQEAEQAAAVISAKSEPGVHYFGVDEPIKKPARFRFTLLRERVPYPALFALLVLILVGLFLSGRLFGYLPEEWFNTSIGGPNISSVQATASADGSETGSSTLADPTSFFLVPWQNDNLTSAVPTLQASSPTPKASPTAAEGSVPLNQPAAPNTPRPTKVPTPSPTPLGGGWAQIAFATNRSGVPNIWIMNVDGSGLTQITDIQEGACQPAWSPNGRRLVFISPCPGYAEVYRGSSLFIMNADGSDLTPLPSVPGGDFDPAWSPDGRMIAFTSIRNNNLFQIFILDLETNELKVLADPDDRSYSQPAWSPDGKKLAVVGPRNQIWVINVNSDERFMVSRPGEYINRHPRWSPDGTTLVFTQYMEGKANAPWIARVRAEVGALAVEVGKENLNSKPSYSPDGYWLLCQGWTDGTSRDIYLMTTNGVQRQNLTQSEANDFDAAWRPGGALTGPPPTELPFQDVDG
jgi:eukaryotic-like serine/threonine-protein kinase